MTLAKTKNGSVSFRKVWDAIVRARSTEASRLLLQANERRR